jgi:hypothetical protein
MHMVGLESKLNDLPIVLINHLMDDLFESLFDWSHHHLAPTLRAPDNVGHHEMYTVSFMLIIHGDFIPYVYRFD